MLEWMERPHRRLNPLTGAWVLVSPQRTQRPWQGKVERVASRGSVPYDPTCYLCPGNERVGGIRNPEYTSTFVFDNDFPALVRSSQGGSLNERDLLVAAPERGVCRVMCFTPRHDLGIPLMELSALKAVVETMRAESISLRSLPFVKCVQIFENRGELMGASNPHPHCQIWAVENTPNEVSTEDHRQEDYSRVHSTCLLCDYTRLEARGERVVCENESFLALVPFWAIWPFEIIVLVKRHCARLEDTTEAERENLGEILRNVTRRYDALFETPFPYTMGFHEQPEKSAAPASAWHFHAHFYPPLLRSATIRKFMVGFELLAGPQRDITPEMAATRLREATGASIGG
jgi:UDPglucose--hexose-1-phosphate uridylyltransferase